MSIGEAIIFGVVQGVTEFLPISSSGHLVVTHALMGDVVVNALAFDVMLHIVTVAVICIYFWRTIAHLVVSLWGMRRGLSWHNPDHIMIGALIIGTLPAGLVGIVWGDDIATATRHPLVVAGALLVGSGVFWLAEYMATHDKPLTIGRGVLIGCMQVLALIPGTSRSGITISGGLFAGLSRARAAEFSFVLAIPVILGAGLVQVVNGGVGMTDVTVTFVVGGAAAALSGLVAVHFLMQFVRAHTLHVFIIYRVGLALLIILGVSTGYIG